MKDFYVIITQTVERNEGKGKLMAKLKNKTKRNKSNGLEVIKNLPLSKKNSKEI